MSPPRLADLHRHRQADINGVMDSDLRRHHRVVASSTDVYHADLLHHVGRRGGSDVPHQLALSPRLAQGLRYHRFIDLLWGLRRHPADLLHHVS